MCPPPESVIKELEIKNFAILENLFFEFEEGLTVFTGETGAGKSLVVDALEFLIGQGQASPGSKVQALFKLSPTLKQLLREEDLDDEVYVSRECKVGGKTISRLNGMVVPLAKIKELAPHLVNVQRQHGAHSLLDAHAATFFLDVFGGESSSKLCETLGEKFEEWQCLKKRFEDLREKESSRERQMDLCQYEVREIEEAALSLGEEEMLHQEKDKLNQAERLQNVLSELLSLCEEVNFARIVQLFDKLLPFESQFESFNIKLHDWQYDWVEFIEKLKSSRETFLSDPTRLEKIIERLDLIHRLQKKYGPTIELIIQYGMQRKRELAELESMTQDLYEVQQKIEGIEGELNPLFHDLSRRRQECAERLSFVMEKELKDLAIPHAQFKVELTPLNQWTYRGMEEAQFLISFNLAEPLSPLEKVASGGELSRIMLALQSILDSSLQQTLVFDEVDAGLGGEVAFHVAQKLQKLSERQQLLCVTHLQQVASMADHHFLLEKGIVENKTMVRVKLLNKKDKVQELARMMAGKRATKGAVTHAEELLERSRE